MASDIMVGGLRLSFLSPVQTSLWPPDFLVTRGIQAERLKSFIPTWLEEGVIGTLDLPELPPSYFSRLFTVRKDRDKWRPIIDLSVLNLSLRKQGFKMEDLKVIAKTLSPGLWGVKLDLKDAFFHVPLAPEVWKYFTFVIQIRGEPPKIYFFQKLPFGLTSAPWAFSRVLKPLKAILRLRDIQVTSYLDDFLILAGSRSQAIDHTAEVITLLQQFGFRINWAKVPSFLRLP